MDEKSKQNNQDNYISHIYFIVWCNSYLWLRKRAMAKKKRRNPIAQILKYFTPKRFKDKTKYERKKHVWKRQIRRGNDVQN